MMGAQKNSALSFKLLRCLTMTIVVSEIKSCATAYKQQGRSLMKVILIVILVAIALFLYRRTQAVAKQERDKTDRNVTPHSSSSEVAQPLPVAEDDTAMADSEHAAIDKSVDDDALSDRAVDNDKLNSAVSVDEPVEAALTEANISAADTQQTDVVCEPKAASKDAVAEVSKSHVEAKVPDTPAVEVSNHQGPLLDLVSVAGDWASESFVQQVDAANIATDLQQQHSELVSVINHCYKMRKQADYCQYGAALQSTYLILYRLLHQQNITQQNTDEIKSPAFMQLSTLLNDVGQFDEAVNVCQQALEYQLTDGTVTGFEGRIKRIEKAKTKVS
jgi:hypothetical protein